MKRVVDHQNLDLLEDLLTGGTELGELDRKSVV